MIRFNILRTIKLVQASFPQTRRQTNPFPLKNYSRVISSTNGIIINGRVKREEIENTEFDHHFSNWKPLIGPNDWQDHKMGNRGAHRYRIENVQEYGGVPGVYELAAVPEALYLKHEYDEPFPSGIVVFLYIGVTGNLKLRLQQHGRNGAHLENGSSGCDPPRLVSGIRARLCLVLFRCSPKNSKEEAQELEYVYLKKYDMAWNAKRNGRRRQEDVHKKLDLIMKERDSFSGQLRPHSDR